MASPTWITSGSGGTTAWVASSTNIAWSHRFSAPTTSWAGRTAQWSSGTHTSPPGSAGTSRTGSTRSSGPANETRNETRQAQAHLGADDAEALWLVRVV